VTLAGSPIAADERGRRLSAIPAAGSGQCIGLFGGSFDPAHNGHRHVCLTALKRLGLDWVWWLVTPGNPLKDWRARAPLARRLTETAAYIRHPKFKVTGFEGASGLRYSADTIRYLLRRRPELRFVWVMGADNLCTIDEWRDWQALFESVPIAVINRPGSNNSPLRSKAAIRYAGARVGETDAAGLARLRPPAWTLLHGPLKDLSSSRIRNKNGCLEIVK
jgi:nicotinate-nucleotide adenylyltransferase